MIDLDLPSLKTFLIILFMSLRTPPNPNPNPFVNDPLFRPTLRNEDAIILEMNIRPRDFYKHYVSVDKAGDTLQWAFKTAKKSLAWGLFYLYDGQPQVENKPGDIRRVLEEAKANIMVDPPLQIASMTSSKSTTALHALPTRLTTSDSSLTHTLSSLALNETHTNDSSITLIPTVGEMLEVIPFEKFDCGERVVKGQLRVPLAGTYVLYFDNSASLQTSKRLSFASRIVSNKMNVELSDLGLDPKGDIIAQGWLLKKKNRRLPGWSQRWFQLDKQGMLCYYEKPKMPCRGAVRITECTVSKVPSRRLVTVDSGTSIWHLRAISDEDYKLWDEALSIGRNEQVPTQTMEAPQPVIVPLDFTKEFDSALTLITTSQTTTQLLQARNALLSIHQALKQMHVRRPSLLPTTEQIEEKVSLVTEGEEEIFYDVEEIILSDISSSEYEEGEEREFYEEMAVEDVPMEEQVPSEEIQPSSISSELEEELVVPSPPEAIIQSWPIPNYRTALPVPAPPTSNIGLASILRKSIGKDWSSLTMPVAINEPLNALQKLAEDFEYSELLDIASSPALYNDSLERLVYVTAFAISSYASMVTRVERKPFTPLLGETFELELRERGFRFLSEKVVHKPLIVACYAESVGPGLDSQHTASNTSNDNIDGDKCAPGARWHLTQDQSAKSKFWGKSVEYIPNGNIQLTLPRTQDTFRWSKVTSCIRNVLSSSKWIEFYGETQVVNERTGDVAKVTFKSNGIFGSANGANEVTAILYSANGKRRISLKGRWDGMLYRELDNDQLQVIWRVHPLPPHHPEYYGFTNLAMILNENRPNETYLKTDTRYRPDQQLLERGMLDEAESEKARVEQNQRDMRALMESEGRTWSPKWFSYTDTNNDKGGDRWVYNGTFWKRKAEEGKEGLDRELPDMW